MNKIFLLTAFLIVHPSLSLPALSAEDCKLCHIKKSLKFMPQKRSLKKEHENYPLLHARNEISCNACHDATNSNYLRTSAEFPASFEKPAGVCQRCHSEVYKDWSEGMHGKITGGWKDNEQGNRKVSQCKDCHNPHSVLTKAVIPKPAPHRPKFVVPKGSPQGSNETHD